MCGIVGLQLRTQLYREQMGALLAAMLVKVGERGPDSAGVGLYGDASLNPSGTSTVSVLSEETPEYLVDAVTAALASASVAPADGVTVTVVGQVRVISAAVEVGPLTAAVSAATGGIVIGTGTDLTVLKGVGTPAELADSFGLAGRTGYQGVGHTRMATESAVTVAHGHPFSVRDDLCLVHNGSFANHDSVRRMLAAEGLRCTTDNDSEVAARFLGWRLDAGDDLEKALRLLGEQFEGFYTLLVTTATEFAVLRDPIACKPAVVAETADWVAMASEYRALAVLPGIESARMFEPEPAEVYLWTRP